MTDEERTQLADLQAKAEALKEPATEVSVKIDAEFSEKLEEAVQKAAEKLVEKQKAFRFHGSKTSELEAAAAQKKSDAVEFIKAVATGDKQKAFDLGGGMERRKALNISNDGTGGYLVPEIFETSILATFDGYSEIIADADVQTFNRPGNLFNFNELSTRVLAFYVDENSAGLTASTPTYTEPQLAIADLIGSTDLTLDFMEDTEADIMADLSAQFGEVMAQKLQARLINGDVTVNGVVTKGIFNSPSINAIYTTNTASGYTGIIPADLEAMFFSAISVDHFQTANKNGKFYMHPLVLQSLRANIRAAATTNDYLSVFEPSGASILGRPIVMTNQAPIPTTTTSNPFVVYGDLRKHLMVRRKRGITMKINDSGTSAGGRNLNYQLGRELVVSQRIGHQVVMRGGLTVLHT